MLTIGSFQPFCASALSFLESDVDQTQRLTNPEVVARLRVGGIRISDATPRRWGSEHPEIATKINGRLWFPADFPALLLSGKSVGEIAELYAERCRAAERQRQSEGEIAPAA